MFGKPVLQFVAILLLSAVGDGPPSTSGAPAFSGKLLLQPRSYETWPVVGASLGLSYAGPSTPSDGPGAFHRVYMEPAAYRTFKTTGAFPEGTMFVLELFEAAEKTSPAKGGWFEGRRIGLEASVKDSRRFPGQWAYFSFENGAKASAEAFPDDGCHACHKAHAARDSVFTQFYPKLRSGG
jgi:hypothetical protein